MGCGVLLKGDADRAALYERYCTVTIEENGRIEDTVRSVLEALHKE